MALLDIKVYGDPVLRKVAEPVTEFGPELEKLAADMLETMEKGDGIGLAAPQVGLSIRFLVIGLPEEVDGERTMRILTMANPEIVAESEELATCEEGCLSLPEINVQVDRPEAVTVEYQDLKGEKRVLEAEGMLAVVVQHEMDHLDGVLITDYLPPLKRTLMRGKLKKLSEQ
ncbi:peptide deformylase [bacterium]|nr:peptide deformylase [bacterium]